MFQTKYRRHFLNLVPRVSQVECLSHTAPGEDLGGGYRGCAPHSMRWSFLLRIYVFSFDLFISPSVTSFLRGAPPPKKNPGSAPEPLSVLAWWEQCPFRSPVMGSWSPIIFFFLFFCFNRTQIIDQSTNKTKLWKELLFYYRPHWCHVFS